MDITPILPKDRQIITGYGNGGFQVNQQWLSCLMLVFADHYVAWDARDSAGITAESLRLIFDADPEIDLLLIGTGKNMAMITPALRKMLKDEVIAFDVMDTGAACRTYNVLVAEERRVAAALLAV